MIKYISNTSVNRIIILMFMVLYILISPELVMKEMLFLSYWDYPLFYSYCSLFLILVCSSLAAAFVKNIYFLYEYTLSVFVFLLVNVQSYKLALYFLNATSEAGSDYLIQITVVPILASALLVANEFIALKHMSRLLFLAFLLGLVSSAPEIVRLMSLQ
jgi:hypothetical protein